ncbi:hypothetical protein Mal4_45330 [Maioricimonas rarisocia]|uniref:Uncharacterized protein n=1 Tax=Maioricimonas rarisocia TaxID=2528026 RepID=A0A517ZCG3_9PLAN|nr:hypothetical protein [Maioricimonas rarisocia]QDU40178.1 hypothetical protein Mal4_45330 [Maioricimonas rarisocia]
MTTFDELAASRRAWIADVLQPWCQSAPLKELRKAADEWGDIAGRVDPDLTLWLWAWSRFPVLYEEGLSGLNETHEVIVTLADGRELRGYPDARQSDRGQLVLLGRSDSGEATELGPISIDDVISVEQAG